MSVYDELCSVECFEVLPALENPQSLERCFRMHFFIIPGRSEEGGVSAEWFFFFRSLYFLLPGMSLLISLCSDTGKALYKGIIYFLIKKLNMIIKCSKWNMYSAPMHNCWQASFCMFLFWSCTASLCRCFVPKTNKHTHTKKTSSSPGFPTE